MAIGRFDPNKPITYGGSAITPHGSSGYWYNDPSRSISVPDASLLTHYQNVGGRYLADHWVQHGGIPTNSGDVASAVNVDAVVVYAAPGPGRHHVIQGLAWSYSGAPTNGLISVECPSGTPIFGPLPVINGGPGFFNFPRGLKAAENADALVRITAGGAGITGAVSVEGHRVE